MLVPEKARHCIDQFYFFSLIKINFGLNYGIDYFL